MKVRLLSLVSALALMCLAAMPVSASSDSHDYLALGDSVAFGYNPLLVAGGQAGTPSVFVGYPDVAARTMGLNLTNSSCPGETTGGFISTTNGQDYLCLPYRSAFPLHVPYAGSQLAFALQFLSTHPTTRLVTMDIGANDFFKLEVSCAFDATCIANGLPGVLASIDANLRFIYSEIRNVAHYHHALVTLTYYALAYDPASAAGTEALNAPIIDATKAFGGLVASGFDAFEGPALATADKSSCAAGLLIVLPAPKATSCDVHPTPLGRDLLAAAIVKAVAESCPAASFNGCLDRNEA